MRPVAGSTMAAMNEDTETPNDGYTYDFDDDPEDELDAEEGEVEEYHADLDITVLEDDGPSDLPEGTTLRLTLEDA